MKICSVVFLLGVMINDSTSMIHTLRYFKTSSSEMKGFPGYVGVTVVNDVVITHYDSDTKKAVPKQEWMDRVTDFDPRFWERETEVNLRNEQVGKGDIEIAKQRLNVNGGPHTFQRMQGCDWNDETDEFRGYVQVAFDGEDFIALDWDTLTWVASKQQAFATKLKWDRIGEAERMKQELKHICVVYLKKYVEYGEKTLKRKELPQVSFLQKSSSSPVTCFATGFYPQRALLFWTKDGDELEEDPGDILPNHDGTFQISVSLDLSTVPKEDWGRYSCVFQLSGVLEDLIIKLDPELIRTNEKKPSGLITVAWVLAAAAAAAVCALTGGFVYFVCFVYRRYKGKQATPQSSEAEVMQELNPQPPEPQLAGEQLEVPPEELETAASMTRHLIVDIKGWMKSWMKHEL